MALILGLESATTVCSAALFKNGECIDVEEVSEPNAHSAKLSLFVLELFKRNAIEANNLDAVAISEGPGSYTGLRIGTSLAKGICFGAEKPLITINTLHSIAEHAQQFIHSESEYFIIPMIDARRMEVYTKIFDSKLNAITQTSAHVLTEESFSEYLAKAECYFCGDGAEKCMPLFQSANAKYIEAFATSKSMARLAEEKFQKNEFADVAYFEPFYLKEFQATVPKKNIFT